MWTSETVPIVGNDPTLWTIAEAAVALGLTPSEVKSLRGRINHTHVFPVGRRKSMISATDHSYTPNRGRFAKVYRASELIEVIELLCIGPKKPRHTKIRGII